nr:dehydrogenase azaj [Quercus suber]
MAKMDTNVAAWIMAPKANPLEVKEAPFPTPGPKELVVHVAAVAINPMEYKVQDYNPALGGRETQYPMILGSDVAGTIVSIGQEVTGRKIGQRVCAHTVGLHAGKPAMGAFQNFVIVPMDFSTLLPDSVSFEAAAVLPLGMDTAMAGLFVEGQLGLSTALLEEPRRTSPANGSTLLVWGGSSSVGCCAIQLAKAAGYEVYATASKRNHTLCESIGASKVFDYSDPEIEDHLVEALNSKTVAGALDCIADVDKTTAPCLRVLSRVEGRKRLLSVLSPPETGLPEGVEAMRVMIPALIGTQTYNIVHRWMERALDSGNLQPKPDPMIIGEGLEYIQRGLDACRQGEASVDDSYNTLKTCSNNDLRAWKFCRHNAAAGIMSGLMKFWKKPFTKKLEFIEHDPSKDKIKKSAKTSPPDGRKRRQQVYEAQKRHRNRNDAYIGSLELEVSRLQHLSAVVTSEKTALERENEAIRNVLGQQPVQVHVQLDALGISKTSAENANLGGALLNVRHDTHIAHDRIFLDRDAVQNISKASSAVSGDSLAALNFILALEWPCKDHVKHTGITSPLEKFAAPAEDVFNGHALTTSHAVCHGALPAGKTSEHIRADHKNGQDSCAGKWYLPHSEIDKLVELSGRLDLSEDQLTPAQAYAMIRGKVPRQDMLKPVLDALMVSLAKYATCCGFGTVLPVKIFWQQLHTVLSKSVQP